jgi:hypothetical protein
LASQQQAISTQVFLDEKCTKPWTEVINGAQVFTGTSDKCGLVDYYPTRQFVSMKSGGSKDGEADIVQYRWMNLNQFTCGADDTWTIQLIAQAGAHSCSAKDVVGDGVIRFVRTLLPANTSTWATLPAPPLAYPPPAAEVVYTCAADDCTSGCDVLSFVRQQVCYNANSQGGLSNSRHLSLDGQYHAISFYREADCKGQSFYSTLEPLGPGQCFNNIYHSASSLPASSKEAMPLPLGEVVEVDFYTGTQGCDYKAPTWQYKFYRSGECVMGTSFTANSTAVYQLLSNDPTCHGTSEKTVVHKYDTCAGEGEGPWEVFASKFQPKMQGSALAKLAGWVYAEEVEEKQQRQQQKNTHPSSLPLRRSRRHAQDVSEASVALA